MCVFSQSHASLQCCLFSNSDAQLFLHLPFQAEDKKTVLPTGLSAAEKADAHEEDELQAAEEVCGPCRSPEVSV